MFAKGSGCGLPCVVHICAHSLPLGRNFMGKLSQTAVYPETDMVLILFTYRYNYISVQYSGILSPLTTTLAIL